MRAALLVLAGGAIGGLVGGFASANYGFPQEYRNAGIALYSAVGAFTGVLVVGAVVWAVWLDRRHARRRRGQQWW